MRRVAQLRGLSEGELLERLSELRGELMKVRGQLASGGSPEGAGKVREIRRTIARILTILNERKG